jgi:hypothetical protein
MYIVSLLHSILALFFIFYGILFTRSRFDYLILIILFSTLLSWTLYKGECPVSYYIKKHKDPNYKLGSNLYSEDMWFLFGEKYLPYVKVFFTTFTPLIQSITVYLLLRRQKFTSFETLLYPILYYTYYHIKFLHSDKINLLFTFVFVFILYRIVKQFFKN